MLIPFFEGYAQRSAKTISGIGEGITISDRSKDFSTTLFGWSQVGMHGAYNLNSNNSTADNLKLNATVQRLRLGSKGFLFDSKLKYLFQVAVAGDEVNTVMSSPKPRFNGLLDAYFEYEVFDGFSIRVGQGFLPVVAEANTLARNTGFADRGKVFYFSGFDRDAGIQAFYQKQFGTVGFKLSGAISQGEGRNASDYLRGGLNYVGRADLILKNTTNPNLTNLNSTLTDDQRIDGYYLKVGGGYSYNDNASRNNGFSGEYVQVERDIEVLFADLLFKTNGFSMLAEFVSRYTVIPVVYDTSFYIIANFNTGWAMNIQSAYCFENGMEIIGRFSQINPKQVNNRPSFNEYTVGFNKYFNSHFVKLQTEVGYNDFENAFTDNLFGRAILLFGF